MINPQLVKISILLLATFSVCSCKDSEEIIADKSLKEIRTEQILGTWNYDSLYDHLSNSKIPQVDCQLDDFLQFNTDGSLDYFTGPLKCTQSDVDRTTPWKLNEAGDSLIVIGDSSNFGRYIELISSNQLILLSAPVSVGGNTIQPKQFFNR